MVDVELPAVATPAPPLAVVRHTDPDDADEAGQLAG
jgi:hypothetical protein